MAAIGDRLVRRVLDVASCDRVVVVAGVPFGQAGTTNALRVATV